MPFMEFDLEGTPAFPIERGPRALPARPAQLPLIRYGGAYNPERVGADRWKPPPKAMPGWQYFGRTYLKGLGVAVAVGGYPGEMGIDSLDDWWDWYMYPEAYIKAPLGWSLHNRCVTFGTPYTPGDQGYAWCWYTSDGPECTSLQSACHSEMISETAVFPPSATVLRRVRVRDNSGLVRVRHDECWTRGTASSVTPRRFISVPGRWYRNPNVERHMPAPAPFRVPLAPEPVIPDRWVWATPLPRGKPPRGPRPRPALSNPPSPRDREAPKASNRNRMIAIYLFRALDELSEVADLVDSIYDALPDDVKKRWERGRKKRGFIDQAGQYGISGADWKLRALYANWHRLDTIQAVRNIIRNHLEDKFIGTVSRVVPRNTINALGHLQVGPDGQRLSHEAMLAIQLNNLFDALGL